MGLKPLFVFLSLFTATTVALPGYAQDSSKHISVTVLATPTFDIDSVNKPAKTADAGTASGNAKNDKKAVKITELSSHAAPVTQNTTERPLEKEPSDQIISAREKEIEKELNQGIEKISEAQPPHSQQNEKYREYYLLGSVLAMTGISLAMLFKRDF